MERRATPVAITGIGCRLPGRIDSRDTLWEAPLRDDDSGTECSANRWDIEDRYVPERGQHGRRVTRWVLSGPRELVRGNQESFIGEYAWRRRGLRDGSSRLNVGGGT